MATVKTGMIDTEDILSNERVIDMSERMTKLQPDEQQFRVMLSKIGSKDAVREIVEWLNLLGPTGRDPRSKPSYMLENPSIRWYALA